MSYGRQASLLTLMMDLAAYSGGIVLASILAAIRPRLSPIILASGTKGDKGPLPKSLSPTRGADGPENSQGYTTAISGLYLLRRRDLPSKPAKGALDNRLLRHTHCAALVHQSCARIYWSRYGKGHAGV
jgi:hypothetical protein